MERVLDIALMTYGFRPFLFLIEEYEKDQDFKKCKLLYDTIERQNLKYQLDLPLRNNEDSELYFKKVMARFGLTGYYSKANNDYYVSKIKEAIENETI